MWDWDASLLAAKEAAESTAALPVDGALLDAFRSQPGSPALATGEGLAYLLDLAILLGGAELARRCARHCKFFPLRRWRARDFVKLTYSPVGPHVSIQELDVLMAALAAGVSIQHLVVRDFGSVSIGEAIALSGDALLWRRVQGLELRLGPGPKHEDGNNMVELVRALQGDPENSGSFNTFCLKILGILGITRS